MLSEEEKKAIEILNELKDIKLKVSSILYSSATVILDKKEKEAIDIVLNLITKLQKEIVILEFQEIQIKNYVEELKKYDYRNIKIYKENKIESPSFTKEQLDLMNLGIALYIGIPKLLEDEEETDI